MALVSLGESPYGPLVGQKKRVGANPLHLARDQLKGDFEPVFCLLLAERPFALTILPIETGHDRRHQQAESNADGELSLEQ